MSSQYRDGGEGDKQVRLRRWISVLLTLRPHTPQGGTRPAAIQGLCMRCGKSVAESPRFAARVGGTVRGLATPSCP